MHVYMYVCIYVLHTHIYIHTLQCRPLFCNRKYIHTNHTYVHTHIPLAGEHCFAIESISVHTIHIYIHTCMHTACWRPLFCNRKYIHTNHTYIHTHMHAYRLLQTIFCDCELLQHCFSGFLYVCMYVCMYVCVCVL